jgi:hypothetical protein
MSPADYDSRAELSEHSQNVCVFFVRHDVFGGLRVARLEGKIFKTMKEAEAHGWSWRESGWRGTHNLLTINSFFFLLAVFRGISRHATIDKAKYAQPRRAANHHVV